MKGTGRPSRANSSVRGVPKRGQGQGVAAGWGEGGDGGKRGSKTIIWLWGRGSNG